MPQLTLEQAFQLALQHHQAGRLQEAEQIYRQILAQQPRQPDVLHLLGVLAYQAGRHDIAVDLIRQAITLKPNFPEAHSNLGMILRVNGQLNEAIAAYRRAIALQPNYPGAHSDLGNVLMDKGQVDEAIAAFRQAIALKANFPEAHNNLGNALRDKRRFDEAVAAFRRAIALKANYPEAHNNLGNVLRDKELLDEAIAAYRHAIVLKPDFAVAHYNLGNTLRGKGQLDEAIVSYRQALKIKPDNPEWRFQLASLAGDGSVRTAPREYVQNLFDAYATQFDSHLVDQLHYRGPEELLAAVLTVAPGRSFDTLDLGCGTGLCGVQFRPYSGKLVGVDLSPKMIQLATARALYDQLITDDIAPALRDRPASFDLAVAGDVFIYVGDLEEVFSAAAVGLREKGLLAFSMERHDGPGFILHSKCRFAHSQAYIRDLSQRHGFEEALAREVVLRRENGRDVSGWIVVLRRLAAPHRLTVQTTAAITPPNSSQ